MSSPNPSSQVSPSVITSSQPSSPQELRHIISAGALTPQKDTVRERKLSAYASQHLGLRVGSRSPTSIPSSPTSVHSSSSAIFERDIEPITPSPPHASHPHRTPRGKATEQLDHAVPTVLDSAATVLSSPTDDQVIAVVAPASSELTSLSGFSSRLSSRSPSPTHGRANMPFMNLPSPSPSITLPLPAYPIVHATPQKLNPLPGSSADTTGVPSPTPTTSHFGGSITQEISTDVQPTPTTATHPDLGVSTAQHSSPSVMPVSPLGLSHPPSPHAATKRLSFISYTDLLTSAPSSTLPLSNLTTSATVSDPPPHLLSVMGIPQHVNAGSVSASPRTSFYGDRDVREGRECLFIDDVGGEWEREGLGQGLEERLESLMTIRDIDSVGVSKA